MMVAQPNLISSAAEQSMRAGQLRVFSILLLASLTGTSASMPAQSDPGYPSGTTPAASTGGGGAATGNANGAVMRIGGGVSAPVPVYTVNPEYSEQARKQKAGGTVLVSLIVDTQGMPQNVHIVRGVGLGLDEKAIEAVKQYRFKPAMMGDKPVAVQVNIQVNFQIFKSPEEAQQAAAAPAHPAVASTPNLPAPTANLPAPIAVPGCTIDPAPPNPADTAFAGRHYADAERLYDDALAANPDSTAAMAGLVRITLAEGKSAEALAMATKYNAAHPNDPVLLDALGEVRFRRGEVDEAAKAFNQAAHLKPCGGPTHYDMYRFLNLAGMHASAQRQLEMAHALAPGNAEITQRWRLTHALPLTDQQRVERLTRQLNSASLTDAQRDGINAAIKGIQSSERGSCELVTPVADAKLPIIPISTVARPDVMYEAGLEVQINGRKRRLEIDTGASGLMLTGEVARLAGLVPEFETRTGGMGDQGLASTFITHVDDIRIGNMEFRNCRVQVLEPGKIAGRLPEDIDGLIGPDVFSDYVVTLDFPQRQMRLGPLPQRPGDPSPASASLETSDAQPRVSLADSARDRYVAPEMKDWTPVFRSGHSLIFPTYIGDAPAKLFIMDTGASHSLISLDAAREVAQLSGLNAPTSKGLNGEVQTVQVADKVTLSFANVRQVVSGMTSEDTSSVSRDLGVGISGFIGFPTLRELVIAIDYRDNLVHVVYDPAKGYHGR
jgi:TonB family protein